MLTEKQLYNKLNNYYKKHFNGENDEFYPNPSINKWKFIHKGKCIVLVCDISTGKIEEKIFLQ